MYNNGQSRGIMNSNSYSIPNALNALLDDVSKSSLNDSEKNAIKLLIERVKTYYYKRYQEILDSNNEFKLYTFITEMTDYIVAINSTLNGKYNVYQIVNLIYKEINYDPQKGKFKIKRLNK